MGYSPGIYEGISNADYHKDPALGSTSLKTLATKTPAHWLYDSTHPKSSDAFDLGTVAHSLILENDKSGVDVWDFPAWTTKASKEARDESRSAGRIPLLTKDWEQVRGMTESVMRHPVASKMLTGHKAEQSVFWEEGELVLKCRPDAWKPGALIDLKTARDANPNEFGKVAADYGYHQSAAHYIDGVKAAMGEELPFHFVLVEKTEPYLVSVVELDVEAINIGRALNDRAKRIYRECADSGNWPGYPSGQTVYLPAWAIYQAEELLGLNTETEITF